MHNPNFQLFPINNNRTAWRAFGLPVILIVPHRRTNAGISLADSDVFNTRIYIKDVPREALVVGQDHLGQRFPDHELYAETVATLELLDRQIDPRDHQFYHNGTQITFDEAVAGDTFDYTTSTGITSNLQYINDADYYDLSDIQLDLELLPSDRYIMVYETQYFNRVISQNQLAEFLCIDIATVATARYEFEINHPGEVINEFYHLTPPPYLTNATKSKDTTVSLYRPFTDILQDIYDEQHYLERINWVFDVPAEAIPYLSSLLGWELPYFPESLDKLRRAVLRRTVEFQNLVGSRRAIIDLFRLFGFEILISNLWWSSDGKRFIRPGEKLPAGYQNEEIAIADICQVDIVLNNYNSTGFATLDIPLLFRPQIIDPPPNSDFGNFTAVRDGGDITIEAYLVTVGSDSQQMLESLAESIKSNPEYYGSVDGCTTDANGFLNSNSIVATTTGYEFDGFSQILLSGKLADAISEISAGDAPLSSANVSFNRETNNLTVIPNRYFDSTTQSIYVFVIYKRQELIVPDILADLQSNRFDIQVITEDFQEFADPVTLEFALEFLDRLKAFHSLLNVVRTKIELTETYEVTDWCVGADIQMRYDVDAGMLQVPPAIIPDIPGAIEDCSLLDPKALGYKDADILLRLRKLTNLPEEHAAWKILDDRPDTKETGLSISPMQAADRENCKYTNHGQDRIYGDRIETTGVEYGPGPNSNQLIAGIHDNPRPCPNDIADNGEFDTTGASVSTNSNSGIYSSFNVEFTETRSVLCELDGITDYCYKGRVNDELMYRPTVLNIERPRIKPCSAGIGAGVYYTYPSHSTILTKGTKNPAFRSLTPTTRYSGKAINYNEARYLSGVLSDYLTVDYNAPLPTMSQSHLGELYRAYGIPAEQTIHYSGRVGLPNPDQQYELAIQRPSLEIEIATMHLPGCRFATMNRLENDFTHDTWKAKPWDDDYSTYCGPKYICDNAEPNFLNYQLIDNGDGSTKLIYDDVPFTVLGNGLVADIQNMNDAAVSTDADFSSDDIIHSIYSNGSTDSVYVTLDQLCEYASDGEFITTTDPLFSSHNDCGTSGILDFIDGYKCEFGFKDADSTSYYWQDVLVALGMPLDAGTAISVLFFMSSGIRDASVPALRMDCGCLVVECNLTEGTSTICSADLFLDDDGYYDWEPDHLSIDMILKSNESVDTCTHVLDGAIPSLLETH